MCCITCQPAYGSITIKTWSYSNEALRWAATDGNAQNAGIRFFINTASTDKDPILGPQFIGSIWTQGANPPVGNNFFGQIGESANPAGVANILTNANTWIQLGLNLVTGVITFILGAKILVWMNARQAAQNNPTPENQAKAAREDVDKAIEQKDRIQDEARDLEDESEDIEFGDLDPIDPVPSADAEAEAEAEVEAEVAEAEVAEAEIADFVIA